MEDASWSWLGYLPQLEGPLVEVSELWGPYERHFCPATQGNPGEESPVWARASTAGLPTLLAMAGELDSHLQPGAGFQPGRAQAQLHGALSIEEKKQQGEHLGTSVREGEACDRTQWGFSWPPAV